MKYANGDTVVGTWHFDRLNGVAKIKGPNDWFARQVLYQDDSLISRFNYKKVNICNIFYLGFSIYFMASVYMYLVFSLFIGF